MKTPLMPHPYNASRAELVTEANALVKVAEAAMRAADAGDGSPMESPACGICWNWKVAGAGPGAYLIVIELSPRWPGFGPDGHDAYPITEACGAAKWEGASLAQRLDLIAWMLDRYAEWLDAADEEAQT